MQVYKKILVAMDCSDVDDAIIEHVALLALQNKAQVFLLHVVHSHTLGQDRALHSSAQTCLKTRREALCAQGVDAQFLLRSGEPDDEVLAEIQGGDYDLVAMATHGHSFMGDLLFGSVSRTLKHKIRIPLLLVSGKR
jgi:universal stress protein A